MMNIFRRKVNFIQTRVLNGRLVFNDHQRSVTASAIQFVLRLALEIEKSDISTSLQKIEKASFDVTGARWAIKGGIISVSLYPEQPETVFAIHAGAKCSTDVEAVFLIQEKIKEMMASLACKDGDCDVIWNSGGGVSKLQ